MRKLARQIAFLMIFAVDMGANAPQDLLDHYLTEENLADFMAITDIGDVFPEIPSEELITHLSAEDKTYIHDAVIGTVAQQAHIDDLINEQSYKWRTRLMLSADRNILRLSIYEMMTNQKSVDLPVFINEAIDLAKIYGNDDSYKFVNAILDGVAKRGDRLGH